MRCQQSVSSAKQPPSIHPLAAECTPTLRPDGRLHASSVSFHFTIHVHVGTCISRAKYGSRQCTKERYDTLLRRDLTGSSFSLAIKCLYKFTLPSVVLFKTESFVQPPYHKCTCFPSLRRGKTHTLAQGSEMERTRICSGLRPSVTTGADRRIFSAAANTVPNINPSASRIEAEEQE
jgi:hypothetical protein